MRVVSLHNATSNRARRSERIMSSFTLLNSVFLSQLSFEFFHKYIHALKYLITIFPSLTRRNFRNQPKIVKRRRGILRDLCHGNIRQNFPVRNFLHFCNFQCKCFQSLSKSHLSLFRHGSRSGRHFVLEKN